MAYIEWLDRYNCHIDTIDGQHREIFNLINQLADAAADRDREVVGRLLSEIISIVIRHFEFEEQLMDASGFGHLNAHKKLHNRSVEKLLTFSQRFDAGECIIEEFHPFLSEWFAHHMEDDKDYCVNAAAEMNAAPGKKKGWFARTFGGSH